LDHIGFLPELVKYGFKGGVLCTEATRDFMKEMLEDAIKIRTPDLRPDSIIKKIDFIPVDDESLDHKQKFGFKKSKILLARDL
jgi:Cft2 family RNA processing exonuclease